MLGVPPTSALGLSSCPLGRWMLGLPRQERGLRPAGPGPWTPFTLPLFDVFHGGQV